MVDTTIARKAIEMLYDCKCTIENLAEVEDSETGIAEKVWQVVASDISCKRSIKNIELAETSDNAPAVAQVITLFLAPEVAVKAGSRITVTDKHGTITIYNSSGYPAVFTNHQEITLELVQKWA